MTGEKRAPKSRQIHVLVVVPQRVEQEVFLIKDGINPQVPHLAREELLCRVYAEMHQRFILFMSPAASGKTSLLTLFARKYPDINCIYVSLLDPEKSAFVQLQLYGINLTNSSSNLSADQHHVIMLDDAQAKYRETGFWNILIKGTSMWLSAKVRFIICATHELEGGVESPVEFKSLPKFVREDFLLSDEEAREFLTMPVPLGLPDQITKEKDFMELVVRECNGLVGALRSSVDAMLARFGKRRAESEAELVSYFLSQEVLHHMTRCFGSKHTTPKSLKLRQFLMNCLVVAPNNAYLDPNFTDEDNLCLLTLKKAGILVEEVDRHVKFSSPLAEKYYIQWLFPTRAGANPLSLRELITSVIGNMSARVLQQSVVDDANFPKEATFQHLFMEGLILNTSATCSICPELSRIFPLHQTTGGQPQKIKGEIDYYLDGDLRWGLELLVNGVKIGEHIKRFTPGGKYVAHAMKDYAVVDLRGNKTGEPTGVTCMENRVSVFFQQGNYSSCKCIFGMDEQIYEIPLKG